eukprot:CAMPEP_0119559236 /NCGR_PEP_ID=MMETSP1352-20130426/12269_1 /TAXON_ID=265584 /ORGANISM="Stauroneis constricta, Strain CCMP1120" /LENGTH=382 /DNA_ID=CAMNT_0007606881 /DNA_START=100 /DNA_END=1248 /DNA_ORIENTATION=+
MNSTSNNKEYQGNQSKEELYHASGDKDAPTPKMLDEVYPGESAELKDTNQPHSTDRDADETPTDEETSHHTSSSRSSSTGSDKEDSEKKDSSLSSVPGGKKLGAVLFGHGKNGANEHNEKNSDRQHQVHGGSHTGAESINDRLNGAVKDVDTTKKRSPELVGLGMEFDHLRKELRALVGSAQKYNDSFIQAETARAEMINEICKLSKGTPLYEDIGDIQNGGSIGNINLVVIKNAKEKAIRFNKDVVQYVAEWESIVSKRVDDELKNCKRLGHDQSHYENKVDKLRQTVNKKEEAGKSVGHGKAAKLNRNEKKLENAFDAHEAAACKACALLEAVVKEGWKDLYPLVESMIAWETDRIQEETKTFSEMEETADRMKLTHKED